jgi:MarR family transcriptional regulator, organic hydroperoxide resistance regulator
MSDSPVSKQTPAKPPWVGLRDAAEAVFYSTLRLTRLEAIQAGFSVPQIFILQALHRIGSVPISHFVVWSGNTPATIGGVLDSLERMGIVRRERSQVDRRQVLVHLTRDGKEACEKLERARNDRWALLPRKISPRDARIAKRVLEHISGTFDARERTTVDPSRVPVRPQSGLTGPVDRVHRRRAPSKSLARQAVTAGALA